MSPDDTPTQKIPPEVLERVRGTEARAAELRRLRGIAAEAREVLSACRGAVLPPRLKLALDRLAQAVGR